MQKRFFLSSSSRIKIFLDRNLDLHEGINNTRNGKYVEKYKTLLFSISLNKIDCSSKNNKSIKGFVTYEENVWQQQYKGQKAETEV